MNELRNANRIAKKLDNMAVIKGSTRNLMYKSVEKLQQDHDFQAQGSIQVQASVKDKTMRGHGYMYSQSLLENLRSPFSNPFKSPLNNID